MRDELLSSWMGRLAKANHCSVEELCGYLGLGQGRVPECASDLRTANWAMLCGAVQRSPDEIVSMALPDTMHHDVQYVSRHDFQFCPACVAKSPDLVLRHWRLAWSMTCEICGQALAAKYPAKDVSGQTSCARFARRGSSEDGCGHDRSRAVTPHQSDPASHVGAEDRASLVAHLREQARKATGACCGWYRHDPSLVGCRHHIARKRPGGPGVEPRLSSTSSGDRADSWIVAGPRSTASWTG